MMTINTSGTPRQAAPVIKADTVFTAKRQQALRTLCLPILGSILAVGYGFYFTPGWPELSAFLVMFAWVTIGLEVGYHRLFAHKAFKTFSIIETFLWTSALMAGQGRGAYWIATHRRHHAHSDTFDDPHSPLCRTTQNGQEEICGIKGLWHAHQGNTYNGYATNVVLYAKDILRNAKYTRLDKQFGFWVVIGLLLPGLVGAWAYGTAEGVISCMLWGGPLRMFIQHQAYFTNGSFAHKYGEQLFDTKDNSRNNWLCSIWTFGSALQNTHHAFASAAYLKVRWYELDGAGFVIRLMKALGLAWDVKMPNSRALQQKTFTNKMPAVLASSFVQRSGVDPTELRLSEES